MILYQSPACPQPCCVRLYKQSIYIVCLYSKIDHYVEDKERNTVKRDIFDI
jgi:hypothetical protein